jgi:hypothetical protein
MTVLLDDKELEMSAFKAIVSNLKTLVIARFHLALENLALRQQLAVLERSGNRPKLRQRDRVFWVLLSAIWHDWRSALMIVKPETVIRWRRQGFRLCRGWKSRSCKPGRPPIHEEIRILIRQMYCENTSWGAPRIESELRLLGFDVAERTVAKYMARNHQPPTQTWRTFLNNHLFEITDIYILDPCCTTLRQFYHFKVFRHVSRLMAFIRSATTNGAANPFSGEIHISASGNCFSAMECNVQTCYRIRRIEMERVIPNEPVYYLLAINSTRFRERGPPRKDGRIAVIANRGMCSMHARAA